MGGGAVVAAAAAAHRRRLNHVLDTFRIAGATAPERARTLDDLQLQTNRELEELVSEGVLVQRGRSSDWWLDEMVYARWRDRRRHSRAAVLIAIALVVAAGLLVLGISMQAQ